jgi:hypothetical protein
MTFADDLIARGLGATDAELGIIHPVVYRVFIRDGGYKRVAELTDWTSLEFVLRFNGVGTWTLETSAESVDARLLAKNGGIIVTREIEGIERTIFSGGVSTEWVWTATTFRAAGRSDDERLEAPALPKSDGPPYTFDFDVRTAWASGIMISYVQANIGPVFGRADRRIPNLVFAPDPVLGATLTGRGNFQPLITLLAELASTAMAGGLGFKLLQSDATANSLEFTVYQPVDRSGDAKFGIDIGTAQDYEDVWKAPEGNYFYVLLGDGFGAGRTVIEGGDAASIAELGRQVERVIDKRGITDTSEGQQALAEALAGAISLRRTAITPFDVPSLQYGTDYDLGDLVTIVTPGGETVDLIREIEISLDPEKGPTITPIVGKGDGTDEERIARYISSVQDRLGNIEKNWTIPPKSIVASMLTDNAVTTPKLIDSAVTEAKLDVLDAPANDEILTYDSASGRLEWQGINTLADALSITSLTASANVTASRFISTIATGTAPLSVNSTTKVTNLNADLLDGLTSSDFALASALAAYLLLTGGTISGSLTVQGALQIDGNTALGNGSSDTTTVTGTVSITATNDQAAFLRHTAGDGVVSLGASHAGSPDLIIKNNIGTQTARVTDAGVLIVGAATAAVTGAAVGDIHCNDVFLVNGANFRRLLAAGSNFQISNDGNTGNHLTISSAGLVTIPALQVDNNDVTLGTNRIAINGTGIGLFGASPIGRPTVTGTRTGTLAQLQSVVASLLSAFDGSHLGAITDLTT